MLGCGSLTSGPKLGRYGTGQPLVLAPHNVLGLEALLRSQHCSGRVPGLRYCDSAASKFRAAAAISLHSGPLSANADVDVVPPGLATDKVGVLLLNLGGPEKLDDVQPFLYNLFADPDIIRLPPSVSFMQPILAQVISTLRAPQSTQGYKSIGGGSPLRSITEDQASAIKKALKRKGQAAEVYVAMRYWHPYTDEAIEQVKRDGITRLVVLPLYPQFSISTSGSSLRLLQRLLETDSVLKKLQHTVIPSWYQRPGYVRAMADIIESELSSFTEKESVEIFFSAHGVPESYVQAAGDPYKEEMEECVRLITEELLARGVDNHHTLAYQSRVGPVEWLKPYTDTTIRKLGAQGVKSMLVVPISFVSEHIETLEEMDMEYRELAESCGIENWRRAPALNTNAAFINDLADAVLEALPFVGSMIGQSESLVPAGEVETLLEAFDREKVSLPSPAPLFWEWGWTTSAEIWNGRLAMVAFFFDSGAGVLYRKGNLSWVVLKPTYWSREVFTLQFFTLH